MIWLLIKLVGDFTRLFDNPEKYSAAAKIILALGVLEKKFAIEELLKGGHLSDL